ncbi:MAG: PHP domain-containing protein [Sphaerochaetaceae bacterium]
MASRIAVRSSYSLLWGTSSPAKIVSFLARQNVKTVGITDINNLYGLHSFIEAAKENGVNYIIGSQLAFDNFNIFAFACNLEGYKNLCCLLTSIKTQSSFNLIEALIKNSKGLCLIVKEHQLLPLFHNRVENLAAAITPNDNQNLFLARKLNIPIAAIDDATFLDPKEFESHKILRSIATSKTLGTLSDTDCDKKSALILNQERFVEAFKSYPDALSETERIANVCKNLNPFTEFIFPAYPHKEKSCFEELQKRVYVGAEKRYGELSEGVIERIEYELKIINDKGFSSYFLVMDDIVSAASRSCGRGSAASSIVSYSLGITNVDPIKHNLYFERFLNSARNDPPDIDVDFAWDERDDLIKSVISHFGSDHCARVANHNHFNWLSALRECAKAYGFSESQISSFNKNPTEDPLWLDIFDRAKSLVGLPSTISMHCGALVIGPRPISEYCPIEYSNDGYPLLAWEKEGVEAAKFVKIDLLGNRSLAVVRDALKSLKEENIEIDENNWAVEEDPLTQKSLADGQSMGVFYIESPAMRQLQIKSKKGDFEHIVIHSSIIRPAANSLINEYLRRLKGGSCKPLDKKLETVLKESYGLLCYQEDLSKIAVTLANFSEADADALRKIISKKRRGAKLEEYEELFKSGCINNNIKLSAVEEIWQMMLSFEGYSFCKAHSASYAKLSFQSAYLKVHHKNHFMAAVLSNGGGYYPAAAYIGEARRLAIELYGPDINLSQYHYRPVKGAIVIGFMAISNLSVKAIETILEVRGKTGLFKSLKEASSLLKLNRDDYLALVSSGSFDSLSYGLARSKQLQLLLTASMQHIGQRELFLSEDKTQLNLPVLKPQRSKRELIYEFEALGFLRDYHSLLLYKEKIEKIGRILAKDLKFFINKRVTLAGILIARKTISIKGGKRMEFISFEDESALYETVVFPHIYLKLKSFSDSLGAFIIEGKVNEDQGAISVEIINLKSLQIQ